MTEKNKKAVYMTALSNEKYIPGVKALKKALKRVKSKHDLVVLLPEDKADELTFLLKRCKILGQTGGG